MTAVAAFPMTLEMRARLAARESAVAMSRTILRGADRHDPADLRLACETLMTYGDHWDWAGAYQVLRALDAPTATERTGTIRAELPGALAGVAVLALVVFGGLAL